MENYEQKYKEAMKTLNTYTKDEYGCTRVKPEDIFPELKESEDEQHRKWILEYLYDGLRKSDEQFKDQYKSAIAWLEKQGEQNLTDKVEPKFKVGDWIVTPNGETKQIEKVGFGNYYFIDKTLYNIIDVDNKSHLWTIQDAKDGDMLAAHECYVIFKEIDGLNIRCYCTYHYLNSESFYIDTLQNKTAFQPATKEQRELLFQKMKEAGYEWDAEKKELRKIEQKPAWSEEDITNLNSVKWIIENSENLNRTFETIDSPEYIKKYFIDWLNSLKDRVQPQPKQEWSEEDKKKQDAIIGILDFQANKAPDRCCATDGFLLDELIDWLKSIKPNHWKPSKEQMQALFEAKLASIKNREYFLGTLYDDLKKL